MIKGPRNFDDKKVNKKTFYKDKNAYDVYDVEIIKQMTTLQSYHFMKLIVNISFDKYFSNICSNDFTTKKKKLFSENLFLTSSTSS